MFRRLIAMAAVTGAAIAVTAAVKILNQKEQNKDKEEEEAVNFIKIEDGNAPEPVSMEESSTEVNEIAELYPYLDKAFIAEQFNRNDTFNVMYPEESVVMISHKAKFELSEVMEEYIRIAEDNGYTAEKIDASEVIISKKMCIENGVILSDIYNVANQVRCLKGIYEGYSIEI